nr:DUF4829 domain-containing protein [uncultured Romboutsia sp.]
MLILSFILTFKSESIDNNAKVTIYNYIECINKKDLNSISKLVSKDNIDNISDLKLQIDNIKNIHLIKIEEETDINLVSDYLKDNSLQDKNFKIFKVNYSVNYENEIDSKTYESLCSLITDKSGKWLINDFNIELYKSSLINLSYFLIYIYCIYHIYNTSLIHLFIVIL